jgi:hypothetical protein
MFFLPCCTIVFLFCMLSLNSLWPPIALQFTWTNNRGKEEAVWKCKVGLDRTDAFYDFYTQSKLEWMLMEVNLLWRRTHRGEGGRIPFFCRHCGETMKNKHQLGHHRKRNLCPAYSVPLQEPLKMFPILPPFVTEAVLRKVFKSLSLPLPYACGGKATSEDELEGSDLDLDLDDDGMGDDGMSGGQEPIIISDVEDSDFEEEEEVPLQKRRRVQVLVKPKVEGGTSSSSSP